MAQEYMSLSWGESGQVIVYTATAHGRRPPSSGHEWLYLHSIGVNV